MAFDGIVVAAMVKELNDSIINGRISKIAGTNCLNRIAGGKIC